MEDRWRDAPIKGIYAPIPTPFVGDEVDFAGMKENLRKWGNTRLAGVVVLGTNGEFVYLDEGERRALIDYVCEHAGNLSVVAGTGCESTGATVALSRHAAGAGAQAVLVLTPHYYKGQMTAEALKKHFFTVADACEVPVILYNMPANTGLNMDAGLVSSLAEHENIIGIKDSSGDIVQIGEIVARTPPEFAVFAGSGSFLFPALALGAVGGTLAVANLIPDVCVDLMDTFRRGEFDRAAALQRKILPLNHAVTRGGGVAALKAALDLIGYVGGDPRPPLLPATKQQREELKRLLADF